MNLEKQTVKRPVRAIRHSGVRQGIREGRKAFSYYAKNTGGYYKKKAKSVIGDFFVSAIDNVFSFGKKHIKRRR